MGTSFKKALGNNNENNEIAIFEALIEQEKNNTSSFLIDKNELYYGVDLILLRLEGCRQENGTLSYKNKTLINIEKNKYADVVNSLFNRSFLQVTESKNGINQSILILEYEGSKNLSLRNSKHLYKITKDGYEYFRKITANPTKRFFIENKDWISIPISIIAIIISTISIMIKFL